MRDGAGELCHFASELSGNSPGFFDFFFYVSRCCLYEDEAGEIIYFGSSTREVVCFRRLFCEMSTCEGFTICHDMYFLIYFNTSET